MSKIKDFIQGNYRYYRQQFLQDMPKFIEEQTIYRLSKCENDCLLIGKCVYCGCPVEKKVWSTSSCNNNERFPDIMPAAEWEEFKKINNLTYD